MNPPPRPDLSFVVPCYNERAVVDLTIPPLWAAVGAAVPSAELLLVDNGSTDGTDERLRALAAGDPRIRVLSVPRNRGYGLGVLTGYRAARGGCIGHIPADGPVDPADVAALARQAVDLGPGTLLTAVRRSRQDTLVRRVVSRGYNALFRWLFGAHTADINGTPKFVHAEDLPRLALTSEDYFLEAEMMIRARRLGLRTVPVTVYSRRRGGGRSKVSARLVRTCLEFGRNLLRARLGRLAILLVPLPGVGP